MQEIQNKLTTAQLILKPIWISWCVVFIISFVLVLSNILFQANNSIEQSQKELLLISTPIARTISGEILLGKNGSNHGHGTKNLVGIRMSMVIKNILREQNSQKGSLHLLNSISMIQRIWLLIMQKCKHRQSKGNLRRNSIFWMIF